MPILSETMGELQKYLLLVEDEENDIFLFQRALQTADLLGPLEIAKDGRQAIDHLREYQRRRARGEQPHLGLIVLDLKLPAMNGFDILHWISCQPDPAGVPVVVLTSSDLDSDRQKAVEQGASDYHVKPMTLKALSVLVRNFHQRWFGKAPEPLVSEPLITHSAPSSAPGKACGSS